MRVVICGAAWSARVPPIRSVGGTSTYSLEQTEVAAAASGKAAGFVALDWCAGTPLDALARRHYRRMRA